MSTPRQRVHSPSLLLINPLRLIALLLCLLQSTVDDFAAKLVVLLGAPAALEFRIMMANPPGDTQEEKDALEVLCMNKAEKAGKDIVKHVSVIKNSAVSYCKWQEGYNPSADEQEAWNKW